MCRCLYTDSGLNFLFFLKKYETNRLRHKILGNHMGTTEYIGRSHTKEVLDVRLLLFDANYTVNSIQSKLQHWVSGPNWEITNNLKTSFAPCFLQTYTFILIRVIALFLRNILRYWYINFLMWLYNVLKPSDWCPKDGRHCLWAKQVLSPFVFWMIHRDYVTRCLNIWLTHLTVSVPKLGNDLKGPSDGSVWLENENIISLIFSCFQKHNMSGYQEILINKILSLWVTQETKPAYGPYWRPERSSSSNTIYLQISRPLSFLNLFPRN